MENKILKTIYFLRHGESLDNQLQVFQSSQSKLSNKGVLQSRYLGERLSNVKIDLLISSTLPRAVQTAKILSENLNQEVVKSSLFIERVSPSAAEGKSRSDAEARQIRNMWKQTLAMTGSRFGDGENYDDVILRADKAMSYLATLKSNNIAVVTHGYFLRTILARVVCGDNITPVVLSGFQNSIELGNASVTVLKCTQPHQDPIWKVVSINDTYHIGHA